MIYLKNIPKHYTGRFKYNPVNMLKTVLSEFMTNGYISLWELEDQCRVNLRFMHLMDHETPYKVCVEKLLLELNGYKNSNSSVI